MGFTNPDADIKSPCVQIPVAASCSFPVQFAPKIAGAVMGSLIFVDDAGTQTITLTGTGVAPTATIAPATFSFGNVTVGSISPPQVFTLTNTSTGAINFKSETLEGSGFINADADIKNSCGHILARGSCTFHVTFTPKAVGTTSGSLTLVDDAGIQIVTLSGTGVAPTVTLTPTDYDFGNVTVGTVSPSQIFTLTNTSKVPLNLKSETLTGTGFTNPLSDIKTCSSPIPAGGSCTFPVDFAPKTIGAVSGTYTFVDDAGTQTVSLSATGVAPTVTLTPTNYQLRQRHGRHRVTEPDLHLDEYEQGSPELKERDPDRCRLHEPSFRHQDMQLAYSGWRILRLSRRLRTEDCRWCGRHLYLRRRRRNSDRHFFRQWRCRNTPPDAVAEYLFFRGSACGQNGLDNLDTEEFRQRHGFRSYFQQLERKPGQRSDQSAEQNLFHK